MFNDLKRKIETFSQQEINIFRRQDIGATELRIPNTWEEALDVENPASEVVRKLWNPTSNDAKQLIDFLASRIMDIVILSSVRHEQPIRLGYVFRVHSIKFQRTYLNAWVAGLPVNKTSVLAKQNDIGVALPNTIMRFYDVHNGFVLNGNYSIGFLPIERLRVFRSRRSDKGLLEFCGDGLGNLRCFNLNSLLDETVDWDHETHNMTDALPFWEFAYRFTTANTGMT